MEFSLVNVIPTFSSVVVLISLRTDLLLWYVNNFWISDQIKLSLSPTALAAARRIIKNLSVIRNAFSSSSSEVIRVNQIIKQYGLPPFFESIFVLLPNVSYLPSKLFPIELAFPPVDVNTAQSYATGTQINADFSILKRAFENAGFIQEWKVFDIKSERSKDFEIIEVFVFTGDLIFDLSFTPQMTLILCRNKLGLISASLSMLFCMLFCPMIVNPIQQSDFVNQYCNTGNASMTPSYYISLLRMLFMWYFNGNALHFKQERYITSEQLKEIQKAAAQKARQEAEIRKKMRDAENKQKEQKAKPEVPPQLDGKQNPTINGFISEVQDELKYLREKVRFLLTILDKRNISSGPQSLII